MKGYCISLPAVRWIKHCFYVNCATDVLTDCLSENFDLVGQHINLLGSSNLDSRHNALEYANSLAAEDGTHGYFFGDGGRDGGRHRSGCRCGVSRQKSRCHLGIFLEYQRDDNRYVYPTPIARSKSIV